MTTKRNRKLKRGHKANGRGCYRIDRTFAGVGRLAISSGTSIWSEFKSRNEMLTHLNDTGRIGILKGIKAGRLEISEVFSAWRTDTLGFLDADVLLHRNLWSAVEQWLSELGAGEGTRKRYATSFKALRRKCPTLGDDAQLTDLRDVNWGLLRNGWGKSAADWNHLRRAVSHFLSLTLGDKYHPIRRSVMAIIPKAVESSGRVPDVTPELFWQIMAEIPEVLQPTYVTLVATGMRIGEYLACEPSNLRPNTYSIQIPGQKSSETISPIDPELWPFVVASIPAPRQYRALRRHFKAACSRLGVPDLRLHDLRHCTGQWLVEAGRPEASVQQTLRHRDPSMTRRYTKQKGKGEDARAMRQMLLPNSRLLRVV